MTIVDVELVRAVIADHVAPVPIALVPVGIDEREAAFVGKALEPHTQSRFGFARRFHPSRASHRVYTPGRKTITVGHSSLAVARSRLY